VEPGALPAGLAVEYFWTDRQNDSMGEAEQDIMKIAAYTQGLSTPSARFRVRSNIEKLRLYNIDVDEFYPCTSSKDLSTNVSSLYRPLRLPFTAISLANKVLNRLPEVLKSRKYDLTWLQKGLVPSFYSLEGLLKQPMLYDVDDAIWLCKPYSIKEVAKISERASAIAVGNGYLADWFSQYNDRIEVIPTAIDIDCYKPPMESKDNSFFTIGWIGTSGNLIYLYGIENIISNFLKKYPESRLLVVSDKKPEFDKIPCERLIFRRWSEIDEYNSLCEMDVGLMPLENTDWARGKCSFKMLQYMACGISTVVSPFGMNAEVLSQGECGIGVQNQDDWFSALEYLILNRDAAQCMGIVGRKIIVSKYSTDVVSLQYANLFKAICL
jgi:glycosyltransferase involved in cell wall biosynthesis